MHQNKGEHLLVSCQLMERGAKSLPLNKVKDSLWDILLNVSLNRAGV
jgi:hypothetical protein